MFTKTCIHPELQLKVEYSGIHATLLNVDITIKDGVFVYKLFDKRDVFTFFIVHMPYIDSKIPKSIFYSALVDEFLIYIYEYKIDYLTYDTFSALLSLCYIYF